MERVGGGAFNPDGTLKLIPLGTSKAPFNKIDFLLKAAKMLEKNKKKPSTFQGSCQPIDKSPKPPDKGGGGGGGDGGSGPKIGGGTHGKFSSFAMPVGTR